MPKAAPKPCSQPGCGVLVRDGSSRCAKHPREMWGKKPTATKRVTGRKLQAMRADLFSRNPLCVECEKQGRVRLATQRDHIVPLAEGGLDDDSNVQGLCIECHDEKSLAERLRGQRRAG
jgi:5-methylcytosine-specific restriction protein A